MPVNINQFVRYLRVHATPKVGGYGRCAKWVRAALEAGGANTIGHPIQAKLWGPTLLRIGFHTVTVENPDYFHFMQSDVMVMQPCLGGRPEGHIAAFDGSNWISDFVQRDFWSGPNYRKERPSYVVYRP